MSYYSGSEFPRAQPENPENLTPIQLVERDRAIAEILRINPDASPKMVEMCWNYIRREGVETVRERINSGFFNKPSEFSNPVGGVLKTAWVYHADGTLVEPEQTSSGSAESTLTLCS
jgi:hypothetical protein